MTVLAQHEMIQRTRQLCQQDEAVEAAMMYGSFARGGGDRFSDIEFVFFFDNAFLLGLDRREWLCRIQAVSLIHQNESGVTAVIFDNLVRGEFHFEQASRLESVAERWRGVISFPSLDQVLIVDRSGRLTRSLQPLIKDASGYPLDREACQTIINRFVDWYLLGLNVLQRGEHARCLDTLWWVHRHLLMMARVIENSTEHWLTPSRRLEEDLSASMYAKFARCTSTVAKDDLERAYRDAWDWAVEMLSGLAQRYHALMPVALRQGIETRLRSLGC